MTNLIELGRADPVGPPFVFLDLLKGYADLLGERSLTHAFAAALKADPLTHVSVNHMRIMGSGIGGGDQKGHDKPWFQPVAFKNRLAQWGDALRPQSRFVENTPWLNTLQGVALGLMEIREVVSFNLRKYRRLKGLSQEELAHRAGIDRTYVSSLERSVYAASVDKLDKIAGVLGIATYELLVPVNLDEQA